jgi:hypothetical protein
MHTDGDLIVVATKPAGKTFPEAWDKKPRHDLLAQQVEAIGSNPIQSEFESREGHNPVTRLAANDSSGHDGTTLHLEG